LALAGLVSRAQECRDLRTTKLAIEKRGGRLIDPPAGVVKGYAVQFINCDELNGEDIALLSGIPRLTCVDLRLSRVEPDVLLAVAQLPELKDLNLSTTRITDNELPLLAAAPCLTRLRLNYTNVTIEGLECFARSLPRPVYFDLAPSQIRPKDVARLGKLPVKRLYLSDTKATDSWVENLPPGLERLSLARTHVTDAGLAFISKLKKLKSLDLSGIRVTDHSLSQLEGLAALKELLVGGDATQTADGDIAKRAKASNQAVTNWSLTDGALAKLRLTTVDLAGAFISNSGVKLLLEKNIGLQKLSVAKTPVTGELEWNAKNSQLKSLDLSETPIGVNGLAEVGKLVKLTELFLLSTDLDNDKFYYGLQNAPSAFRPEIFTAGSKITLVGKLMVQAPREPTFLNKLLNFDQKAIEPGRFRVNPVKPLSKDWSLRP
jgi:Leucine-rich repeat (LRR) protein